MADSDSLLYLWLTLREPSLLTLQEVISAKAEHGYVQPLSSLKSYLRGAVFRFLRYRLDYYRDDNMADLYCRDVWPLFCELHRIILGTQDVGSSRDLPENRAYLFFSRINKVRPELFEEISLIGEKYLSAIEKFKKDDGIAMYKVRRRTDFLGRTCGRIFGFFSYSFRAENICYNDDHSFEERLKWLRDYLIWLKDEEFDYLREIIVPNCEHIAACGFRGMSGIPEYCGDNNYYGEFSYIPFWNNRLERGTFGVAAWFRYHLNEKQLRGLLFTTESVKRGEQRIKDLCCFWPSDIDIDKSWPEERYLAIAEDYLNVVGYYGVKIWSLPKFKSLDSRERITTLELALSLDDNMPWVYYHLANEYRELNEELIYGDLIRLLWRSPTLLIGASKEFIQRIEDEYFDVLRDEDS